jgi:ankyrin repeat protein
LDAGANPNHNCFGLVSTLDKILAKKRFDVGNLLIQYGCNPNKKDQEGITPLYRYLREKGKNGEQCDLETLEFLLNHVDPEICVRKKIEEQHFSQDYPIYCVSDPKAAELMLKYGAKIDDKFSSLGDCLLMEMCKIANFSMIEFYVNAGLDINRKNNMDNTPLGIAFSSFGDTQEVRKIAKFLLEKGANPNVCYASQRALNSISFLLTGRKPKDDTLLQYVIKQNDSKMVKHLLFYGANPYLKNSDDKDTFDLLDDFEMCSDLKGGKDYRKEKFLKHLGRYQLNTLKRKRNARQLKLKEMYQLNALNLGDKI